MGYFTKDISIRNHPYYLCNPDNVDTLMCCLDFSHRAILAMNRLTCDNDPWLLWGAQKEAGEMTGLWIKVVMELLVHSDQIQVLFSGQDSV